MIVAHIIGGLGNQMFQYAAGRALAASMGQHLYLDVSDFAEYRLHNGFELPRVFTGQFSPANEVHIQNVLGWRSIPLLKKLLRHPRWKAMRGSRYVIEPHFNYWENFVNLTQDSYLVGYWQSEKYFKEIQSIIRQDFTFKSSLYALNQSVASRIAATDSVSLHIRRGDYANNPKTTATHGLLPLDYYRNAISYMGARVATPAFYVFSDDIEWAKAHLQIPFASEFIGHNKGANSYLDMQLMSLCKHNIIANSSFSWWGAWLNAKVDKIVVAPSQWFAHDADIHDLLPSSWIRI